MGHALVTVALAEEQVPTRGAANLSEDCLRSLAGQVAANTWAPPREPSEPGWHRDLELRKAHNEAVRQSLERFLNDRLAELDGMVRTGRWILQRARIRVVDFGDCD
jgi:hypothetical protein